jgi:transcriptional regulator with XRE-family HTH domain
MRLSYSNINLLILKSQQTMRLKDICDLDPVEVGLRIREARERKHLSQEDLAASMGVDQRAVSELENGKRRLPITEVSELSLVLGVPVLYFFGQDISPDDLDIALLEQFHRLPNHQTKKSVIGVVRAISDTVAHDS